MPEDKYSLVNCYLYHIYKQIQQDGKTDEFKKKFIKFIVEHENDYKHFMQPHKTIDNYIHNLSSKLHLQALHEMAKINILVFEYNGQNDQLSENYYRNPLFQTDTCLFLMYYDHSKHYDYCNMEKTEGYQLPDKKGKKCKKGTKYFELASFDSKILKRTDNIPDVSARNSRYTQLNSSCLQHNNIYSFGKNLWYGDEDEYNTPNSIVVSPKYNCLKQELISNQIAVLSVCQFDNEYNKALIHFQTNYRKETHPNSSLQNLLALMVHCNYDVLQREFNKTFRHKSDAIHDNFYHFGKLLKMSIHKDGFRTTNNRALFYHGINGTLLFPSYINDVIIHSPLSTSTSFDVAVNFASMDGLIVTFKDHFRFNKCYDVCWLSDYPNESEHLFIQNPYPLVIVNIIEYVNCYEYKRLLNELRMVDKLVKNQPVNCVSNLANALCYHQVGIKIKSMSNYGNDLINIFFMNRKKVEINYTLWITNPKYWAMFNLFFQLEGKYPSIRLHCINQLFPHLQDFLIYDIDSSTELMDSISPEKLRKTSLKSLQLTINPTIGETNEELGVLKTIEMCKLLYKQYTEYIVDHQAMQNYLCVRSANWNPPEMIRFDTCLDPKYSNLFHSFGANELIKRLILAVYKYDTEPTTCEKINLDTIIWVFRDNNITNKYFSHTNNNHKFKILLQKECKINQEASEYLWNSMAESKSLKQQRYKPPIQISNQNFRDDEKYDVNHIKPEIQSEKSNHKIDIAKQRLNQFDASELNNSDLDPLNEIQIELEHNNINDSQQTLPNAKNSFDESKEDKFDFNNLSREELILKCKKMQADINQMNDDFSEKK
eukprot:366642_1